MATSRPRSYLICTIVFGSFFAMAEAFDHLHFAFGAFSTFLIIVEVFNHAKRLSTLFGLLRDVSEASFDLWEQVWGPSPAVDPENPPAADDADRPRPPGLRSLARSLLQVTVNTITSHHSKDR